MTSLSHSARRGETLTLTSGKIWRHVDWPLFLVTVVLMLTGVVMIYSSYGPGLQWEAGAFLDNAVLRQLLFGALGLVVYWCMAALDYYVLVSSYRWLYAFVLGLLGVTLFIGRMRFGAQSWIDFEVIGGQPSELCKVLVIVVVAQVLGGDHLALESPKPFLLSGLLVLPPVVLIYLQPDFGTALILFLTWVGMVFLAGVRWRHILALAGVACVVTPLVWFQLKDYMRERILLFLFPSEDLSGASYNVHQALISIGSGGWWGKGILKGTQSQLHFLRVRHTDFIFSVLAEELGFVGSLLFLVLVGGLILRLVHIALKARDRHGRLIVSGVAIMLLAQTFINLGMNANLLPVTGLPLPLISYGGSSLVSTLMALGLAQGVAMRSARAKATQL